MSIVQADHLAPMTPEQPSMARRSRRRSLPLWRAFPTFSSPTLSSLAYAPDEILRALALGGASFVLAGPWVAAGVVVIFPLIAIAVHRAMREYPEGGGDHHVVRANLGAGWGRLSGAALSVDFIVTVAISLSQAAAFLAGAFPIFAGHETSMAIALLVAVALVNLRSSGIAGYVSSAAVYLFLLAMATLLTAGFLGHVSGRLDPLPGTVAGTADTETMTGAFGLLGAIVIVARAFAGGSATMTGTAAIRSAVPIFPEPKERSSALILWGSVVLGGGLLLGLMVLARATGVSLRSPRVDPGAGGTATDELPVIAQLAERVFGSHQMITTLIMLSVALVLCVVAASAFHSFPQLATSLAKVSALPRGLSRRADTDVYSRGVTALAIAAGVTVVATGASVSLLITMYVVGVFISMALAHGALVRHYHQRHRIEARRARRRILARARTAAGISFAAVMGVLIAVMLGKFLAGAWIAVAMILLLWFVMTGIERHYRATDQCLALREDDVAPMPQSSMRHEPSHGFVLIRRVDRASLHAVSHALSSRHLSVEAIAVDDGDLDTATLIQQWHLRKVPCPLRLVYSPSRDLYRPVQSVIKMVQARWPHEGIVIYVPEVDAPKPWSWFLYHHTSRQLRSLVDERRGVEIRPLLWSPHSGPRERRISGSAARVDSAGVEVAERAERRS